MSNQEVTVTRTEENELLISKIGKTGSRINILVDEEGNIELLTIPLNGKVDTTRYVSRQDAVEYWNEH